MKPVWTYMTGGDWLLVAVLVLVGLAGLGWVFNAPRGERVVVSRGDRVLYLAGFETPAEIMIAGPLGTTRLAIAPTGVRVLDSPCPQKLCMGMGPARHQGELIACVPNRLLIRVEGGPQEEADYDLLSR